MGTCDSYYINMNGEGTCYGTKERDACGCKGDESRCDFYPEKREKANKRCLNADLAIEDIRHLEELLVEEKIKLHTTRLSLQDENSKAKITRHIEYVQELQDKLFQFLKRRMKND